MLNPNNKYHIKQKQNLMEHYLYNAEKHVKNGWAGRSGQVDTDRSCGLDTLCALDPIPPAVFEK